MPKTQKDLLFALLERIGGSGDQGRILRAEFEQRLLPNLKLSKKADEVLSDDEYEAQLKKLSAELPGYLHWLMSQKFPTPPPIEPRN